MSHTKKLSLHPYIINLSMIFIWAYAHGAEKKLRDCDKKINTALNCIQHAPPTWTEESRYQLLLILEKTCNLPHVLGNIIVAMMGDGGCGTWFPHATINNGPQYFDTDVLIATLPHGRFAATSRTKNSIIRVYDSEGITHHELSHNSAAKDLATCSHGSCIAASSADGIIEIWDINAAPLRSKLYSKLPTGRIQVNRLLELPPHGLVINDDNTIQLWDIQQERCLLKSDFKRIISVPLIKLSTENVAIGYRTETTTQEYTINFNWGLAVWNTKNGTFLYIPNAHDEPITAITSLPNGLFATASYCLISGGKISYNPNNTGIIKVWNSADGNRWHTLRPYRGTAHALIALHDGNFASGACKAVDIWNPITGKRIRTLRDNSINIVHALLELPHGRLAAGGSEKITIWNVATGNCLQILTEDCGNIVILRALSDGKLLSADRGGCIKIWKSAIHPAAFKSQSWCCIS